jgi:hypothetical protein
MSGLEGMQANQRTAVASREYVYGQVRKGGTITYMESTGVSNRYMHMVLVWLAMNSQRLATFTLTMRLSLLTVVDCNG